MDGLISILIIIGISMLFSSGKKKKQMQEDARKKRAFQEAAETQKAGMPAHSSGEIQDGFAENKVVLEKMPEASRRETPAEGKIYAKSVPLRPKAADHRAVRMVNRDDAPEGSVSTQGESPREHALHRQRILAREEALRLEHEEMQQLRDMNLQKLRAAVVMSEILDKPVSLRPRKY